MSAIALWRFLLSAALAVLWIVRVAAYGAGAVADALLARAVAGKRRHDIDTRIAVVVGCAAIALYLLPTLGAGLAKSDTFKLYMSAYARANHMTPEATFDAFRRDQTAHDGGLFPLAALPLRIWQSSTNVDDLRLFQLAAVALNALTFGWFVARASGSGQLTMLALGSAGLAMQLRIGPDPIIGPLFVAQSTVEWTFLALGCATSFALSSKPGWFLATIGFALGAALGEGFGYVACGLAALMVLSRGVTRSRTACAILLFTIPLAHVAYGVKQGLAPRAFASLTGATTDVLSALPTSYRSAGKIVIETPKASNADTRFSKFERMSPLGWFVVAAFATIFFYGALRPSSRLSNRQTLALVATAAALWIVAAFFPEGDAVPGRPLGSADDRVYLETFGVGLLAALAIRFAVERVRGAPTAFAAATAVALVAAIVMYGNVRANDFVISRASSSEIARRALERAAAVGLFADIPAGSTIVLDGIAGLQSGKSSVRDGRFALYALAAKRYVTATHAAISPGGYLCRVTGRATCLPRVRNVYLITSRARRAGGVEVTALHWAGFDARGFLIDRGFRLALHGNGSVPPPARSVTTEPFGSGLTLVGNVLAEGSITHMVRTCGPVSEQSAFKPDAPSVSWASGFYPPYPAVPFIAANSLPPRIRTSNPWSFAGKAARLVVRNVPCAVRRVRFTAEIFTAVPATVRVRYAGVVRSYATSQDGANVEFLLPTSSADTDVQFETNAHAGPDLYIGGREVDAAVHDFRMLVKSPSATLVSNS